MTLVTLKTGDMVTGWNEWSNSGANANKIITAIKMSQPVNSGQTKSKCSISEIQIMGIQLVTKTGLSLASSTCPVFLTINEKDVTIPSSTTVTYKESETAVVSSMNPVQGTTAGGTVVKFMGTGFSSDKSKVKVSIDGIDCPVSASTVTQITCTTGKRPTFVPSVTQILINGKAAA